MADMEFSFDGLDDLQGKLDEMRKKFPQEEETLLKKAGNKLRRKSKEKTPVGKGKKHLKDSYKLSKVNYEKDEMNITMTNTSPHFHLVEKGHRQVTKDGREIGYIEGKHMVETSMSELEMELPLELNKWLDKILR